MKTFGPLVDATWLAEHIRDAGLGVVDFRGAIDGRPARAAYEAGHIPGAVFVDMEGEVTGHRPGAGRHPLPERDAFERVMRAAGIGRDTRVVVYDDQGAFTAGRLWWMLRYFGHDAVAVLDGGLQAWTGPLESGRVEPAPGDFLAAPPREAMKLDFEEVRALPPGVVLLDARSPERFGGEPNPLDPRPGHIPGARSAFWKGNLREDQRFRSPDDLRRRYEELGVRDDAQVVLYCGSGVSACNDLLAMEVAGLPPARLYPGSWSDWASRPDTPAELAAPES